MLSPLNLFSFLPYKCENEVLRGPIAQLLHWVQMSHNSNLAPLCFGPTMLLFIFSELQTLS